MDAIEIERLLDLRFKPVNESLSKIEKSHEEMAKTLSMIAVQGETLKHHRELIDANITKDERVHDELYTRLRIAEQDISKNKDCNLAEKVEILEDKFDKKIEALEVKRRDRAWDVIKVLMSNLASAVVGGLIALFGGQVIK